MPGKKLGATQENKLQDRFPNITGSNVALNKPNKKMRFKYCVVQKVFLHILNMLLYWLLQVSVEKFCDFVTKSLICLNLVARGRIELPTLFFRQVLYNELSGHL